MGSNNRFRFSDMMPNSWFYKLRDMSIHGGSERMSEAMKHRCSATTTAAASTKLKPISQPSTRLDCIPTRSSVYYSSKERTERLPHSPVNTKASDTHFPTESPRRSASTPRGQATKPYSAADGDLRKILMAKHAEHINCEVITSSRSDVVIDMSSKSCVDRCEQFEDLEAPEPKLPPIITKPSKQKQMHSSALDRSIVFKERNDAVERRLTSAAGARVTRGERHQNYGKQKVQLQNKVLSESFVVVKSSMDPQNDFWASMVEMIVENEIRRPTDLEELLACYLSLNSKEFHGIIIKVFAQIWFDLGLHRE